MITRSPSGSEEDRLPQAAPDLDLSTGVAVAFPRSPFVTAATAQITDEHIATFATESTWDGSADALIESTTE
jgi:hypothetical protein